MKRIFSIALVLTMLVTMMQAFPVSAETTLEQWMFYDFELDEGETQESWVVGTSTADVYDIGTYRNEWRAANLNLNGATGITKTDGMIMEVEFDCKIGDLLGSNTGGIGGAAIAVNTGVGEEPDSASGNFYGSVSAVKDITETNKTGFSTGYYNNDQAFGAAELDKWYRVKMVMPIGNTRQTYSVHVDGVKTGLAYQTNTIDETKNVVKFLTIVAGGGYGCIDNLRVVTYTNSADAPVDKGALVAAIRDFLEDYPDYTSTPDVEGYITEAKATYENPTATADDVTTAIAKVDAAKTKIEDYTTLEQWMFYDFELDEGETQESWVGGTSTADVYDIGTYRNEWRAAELKLNGETGIEKTEGLTMEVEFDCRIGDFLDGITLGGSTVYVSTGVDSVTSPGYSNHYGAVAADRDSTGANTGFTTWQGNGWKHFGAAELDKWYRVKMVTPIGGTAQAYSVYIDGVKAANVYNQQGVSATDVVKFLCVSASGVYGCIDNLKAVTYTRAMDAPVDKGALIAAIRDFEAEYTDYKSIHEAAAYIASAKATYKKDDATADDVTAAIANIALAEEAIESAGCIVSISKTDSKIDKATVKNLSSDVTEAKLIVALYSGSGATKELEQCQIVDVEGNGEYPIDLEPESENLTMEVFMFDNMSDINPVEMILAE